MCELTALSLSLTPQKALSNTTTGCSCPLSVSGKAELEGLEIPFGEANIP